MVRGGSVVVVVVVVQVIVVQIKSRLGVLYDD